MQKVIQFLNSHIKDNDNVIVALSGGVDSMALFHMINCLNKNITIICAHVNHKWRKESDYEYDFLKNYVEEKGHIFEGIELHLNIKNNFEANARKARYEFFEYLRTKYKAKYIITAHHGDDQIETILMRISRGSNLSGYVGLKAINNHYLKPLLYVTKEEIIDYARDNKLPFFVDKTNKIQSYTRNRYRKKVLPFLKKENEDIHLKYIQFSKELEEYNKFICNYINKKELIKHNKIIISNLLNEPEFICKKTIELLIKEVQKDYPFEVNNQTVLDIIKLIKSKKSNATLLLRDNFIAEKNYNEFRIVKNEKVVAYDIIFNKIFENELFIIKQIEESNERSNFMFRLNSKQIKMPIHIRSKNEKDVMHLKNSGHKRVKNIFIDSKIRPSDREIYPIVTDDDNNILWIPGIKKSNFDKDKDEKYDIILASERKIAK